MSEKKKKGGCFKILIKGAVGLLAICVFFAVVGELGSEKPRANIPAKTVSHEVIKVIPYDAPVKTQLEYQVLLKQQVSKGELRKLLKDLYEEASKKRGFKHHGGKATHIFIYVYPSAEHTQDQWIGMMSKVGKDAKAEYTLKDSFFSQPPTKTGQNKEEVRKKIFKELLLAEKMFPVAN